MAKRSLLSTELLRADTQAFLDVLNKEPDFSVVVVSLGYLDACLGSLLHSFLIDSETSKELLDPVRGQLGSFAARSKAAYSLGLICKPIYQDLMQLAQIRNLVAHHHLTIGFSNQSLQEACVMLKYLATMKNGDLDELAFPPERMPPPKERFKYTVLVISDYILRRSERVQRRQTEV